MFEVQKARGNVWELIGRLGAAEAEEASVKLAEVEETQILDLARLDYISSAGLGVLLQIQRRLSTSGQTLKLTNIQRQVREVFRYSGLDQVFEVVDAPVFEDPARPKLPDHFRYKILEEIGRGSTGQVFLARDFSLDRRAAIKFLSDKMLNNETARRRFLREARAAASLDNPFICKVFEVGEVEGKLFIAMEYLEGRPLSAILTKEIPPWRTTVRLAREMSEALAGAHKAKTIHRDLRPANIMVTTTEHIKIMDFGSVKPLAGAEWRAHADTLTVDPEDESLILSSDYASPEQIRGEDLTFQSDIFSFGIILYEMLTGIHPFKRKQAAQTIVSIVSETPRPVSTVRTDVPATLDAVVNRTLAKDPEDRYPSFDQISNVLEAVLEGRGQMPDTGAGESEKPTKGDRLRAWFRKGSD